MASGYITLPGVASNDLTTPDASALDITPRICIVANIAPVDWTPAANVSIVGKWAAAPNLSYLLQLLNTGALKFFLSADGSTTIAATSTVVVPSVTDGVAKWVASCYDGVDGSNRRTYFWTSTDGSSWTQVGTTVTVAANATIANSNAVLRIGAHSTTLAPFNGVIHHISVRDGIGASGTVGGTEVFRFDGPTDLIGVAAAATSFTAGTGQTVTVNRSGGSPTVITPPMWGSIAVTADADTSAADGYLTRVGTVAWSEDADTAAVAGASTHTGTVAWSEDADTMVAAGSAGAPKDATVAWTEDADTAVAAATATHVATLSWTEADDAVVAAGGSTHEGAVAWLEADDTMVAAAASTHAGPAAWLEADDTATVAGTSTHTGTIAWTEAGDTCVAAGRSYPPGTVAWAEDADTAAAAGGSTHVGTSVWTEADDTMLAAATAVHVAALAWLEAADVMAADGFIGFRVAATSTGTISTVASTGSIAELVSVGAITTTEVA